MRTWRIQTIRLLKALGVLAFIIFGAFTYDYNDRQNDQKMINALAFDALQNFFETGDPNLIAYPYIGSKKTRTFHRFGSDCTRQISSFHLMAFKNRYTADKAGYTSCPLCIQKNP